MNNKTYYHLILDRSGSMTSCADATISGFNEQIQMIRDMQRLHSDQEILVSLTTFNHTVTHPVNCSAPDQVRELDRESYVPDGSTALLDAIGESVMSLKARAGNEFEHNKASAIVIILTDGHENASKLFNIKNVRNMVRELEDTGKWTFTFLGADMAAIDQAENLNIRRANAARYSKEDSEKTFMNLSQNLTTYIMEKKSGKVAKDFLKKDNIDSEDLF